MARAFYVLNVDFVVSSKLLSSDDYLEKISRVLENCFRFFVGNAGVPEDMMVWAGDGGFALFDTEPPFSHRADEVVGVARSFSRYVGSFINKSFLELDMELEPTFRVTVGMANVKVSGRISNYFGPALSLVLKYEREFGAPGHVSILDEVYKQLGEKLKSGFTVRDREVHDQKVYDQPFEPEPGSQLGALVLAKKEDIDQTTIRWLIKAKKAIEAGRATSASQLIGDVFTFEEILTREIVPGIHDVFAGADAGTRFRVSYARLQGEKLTFVAGGTGAATHSVRIGRRDRSTAACAWRTGRALFVASTKAELKRGLAKQRFCSLYRGQKTDKIGSIACFPIIASAEDQKRVFFGVVCVDTSTDGYFDKKREANVTQGIQPLLTELVLAELYDGVVKALNAQRVRGSRPARPRARVVRQ